MESTNRYSHLSTLLLQQPVKPKVLHLTSRTKNKVQALVKISLLVDKCVCVCVCVCQDGQGEHELQNN